MVRLPLAARRDGAEVLHVQYTVSPFGGTPTVTTVHDVSFMVNPGWFRPKDRLLLTLSVPRSVARARKVITVSETSKKDILRHIRVKPDKVAVTPLAAPPEFAPVTNAAAVVWERLDLAQPYLLALGTLQPRKNFALVARAFERAHQTQTLAIAGKQGWGDIPGGRLLGYVADDLLPALYSAAEAFLFPSHYEGFGIPALEAMACGCPVICSDGGALPEVAEEAALVCGRLDEAQWTEAIQRVCGDPNLRETLRGRGLERVKMFDWRATARRTVEVYEEVAQWSPKSF